MDPICHTLVGATLARSGLEKMTPHGTATLIVAANLPDVDVLSYICGPVFPYAFRRGLTHGLPAMIVLPILLALLMLALSRIRTVQSTHPSFRWLLILSAIGVASHPVLDWLNNYGMRWLSPFNDTWSYGDTLFIIDLFVWAMLIIGFGAASYLSRTNQSRSRAAAHATLIALLGYAGINVGITSTTERVTMDAVADDPPLRIMASPVQLTPFARDVVMEYPSEYRFARVEFTPSAEFLPGPQNVRKGSAELLKQAARTPEGDWFLRWARFPYVVARDRDDGKSVLLADARYVRNIDSPRWRGFGIVEIDFE